MTIRPILKFPDPKLRTPCWPVEQFDSDLAALVADLAETMRAAPGIGITTAHIGELLRVVFIELEGPGSGQVYVNPVLVWVSADLVRHAEGSVSMPGVSEDVERPARIRVTYQDIEGMHHSAEASGLLAVCLQHEIDQLDGMFWIERLSRLKRERVIKKYRKLTA
ncbi:peptide deformylase [Sinorhizobium sp. BG8]|uniref:peptide deformylase n=1 Tax=Sinorhizobium sp. BG8 TaxID=2613773 RepID=UPI00193D7771|nr:peptide deformylase [Sinorhizobium sp. BG8]QRM55571.1 peptide deformylase [Sinorhizobium sp. BG8]